MDTTSQMRIKQKHKGIFPDIFNEVSDVIVLMKVDLNRGFQYENANRAAMESEGFTAERFGKYIEDVHDESYADFLNEKYRRVLTNGTPVVFEDTITNSTKRHVGEAVVIPIYDETSLCTHLLVIARDITKRREMEESLHTENALLENYLKLLVESKQRYQSLFQFTPNAVFSLGLHGNILSVNPKVEELMGCRSEELVDKSFWDLLVPEELPLAKQYFEFVRKGKVQKYDIGFVDNLGQRKEFHLLNFPIVIHDEIVGVYAVGVDLTDRKQAEEKIRASESKYQLIADNTSDLIKLLNVDGKIVYASPSHERELGIEIGSLQGQFVFDQVQQEDVQSTRSFIRKLIETRTLQTCEVRQRSQEKGWIWYEIRGTPVLDEQNRVKQLIIQGRNINERKKHEEHLAYLAYHDTLTGIPNRRYFEEQIANLPFQSSSLAAVLYLDCDWFKKINDTLGHDIGDEFLRRVAQRLQVHVRSEDLVARIGGDEFVILLNNLTSEQQVIEIARGISRDLQGSWEIKGYTFKTSSSIGIALYPEDGRDPKTLIKCADQALYKAKENGRNKVQMFRDLQSSREAILEKSMREALEYRQFTLCFQPKNDLKTGRLIGVEALIRWQHPQFGWVPPMEFIPLAEKTGFIIELTRWVLQTACQQHIRWIEQGLPPIKIAVNVSAVHFHQQNLEEMVEEVLAETGMNAQYLGIEITESAIAENIETVIASLQMLKNMGIEIAIDDFGTGYSSLSYLKHLPIDIIKIDKSFVEDVANSSRDATIVSVIVLLAHALSLKVVAEGVETENQLNVLEEHQCDIGQGYLFAKPLFAEELEIFVKGVIEHGIDNPIEGEIKAGNQLKSYWRSGYFHC